MIAKKKLRLGSGAKGKVTSTDLNLGQTQSRFNSDIPADDDFWEEVEELKTESNLSGEQMFSNMKLTLQGALEMAMVPRLTKKPAPTTAKVVELLRLYSFDERNRAMTIELPPGRPTMHPVLVDELEMIALSNNYPVDRVFVRASAPEASADDPDDVLNVVSGRDVKAASPKFFLDPYLPDGALSILFGDGGTGKTSLALWMLARLSKGETIFGQATEPQDVMLLSNEDSPEISQGRFLAYGGDRRRISYEKFDGQTFALANIDKLKATVAKYRPKVLVLDSVMSHLGGQLDAYRHNEVAAVLGPLESIAVQYQTVILGLMHMNKQDASKVVYRVGGSVGFVTASRSALFVEVKPDEPNSRILCHVKANYSGHGRSQEFQILDHREDRIGRVQWVGPSELKASDLLAKPDGQTGGKELEKAKNFLTDRLIDGELPANEIYAAAEKIDIAERTLERAKKALGIESRWSSDRSHKVWVKREKAQKRVGE